MVPDISAFVQAVQVVHNLEHDNLQVEVRLCVTTSSSHHRTLEFAAMNVSTDGCNSTLVATFVAPGFTDKPTAMSRPRTATAYEVDDAAATLSKILNLCHRATSRPSYEHNHYTHSSLNSPANQDTTIPYLNTRWSKYAPSNTPSSSSCSISAAATPDSRPSSPDPQSGFPCPIPDSMKRQQRGISPDCESCAAHQRFPTAAEAKEHVVRVHHRPHYCPRCGVTFPTIAVWSSHINARTCSTKSDPLSAVPGVPGDTMDRIVEWMPDSARSETENWEELRGMILSG